MRMAGSPWVAVLVFAVGLGVILAVARSLHRHAAGPRVLRLAAAAPTCPDDDWRVTVPCASDGACGPNATQTEVCASQPSVQRTVPCAGPPCYCLQSDLEKLLGADASNVTFCGGVCDRATAGQQCILGCKSDTVPNDGVARVTCLGDGSWAWNAKNAYRCTPTVAQCPDVKPSAFLITRQDPASGVRCQGATAGDKCVISCHIGTAPANNVTEATCLSTGAWSAPLACAPQDCGGVAGCLQYAG